MPWILRDLPQPLWSNLQDRATREGWPLKALILQLVQDYVEGKISPGRAPATAATSLLVIACPNGHTYGLHDMSKSDMREFVALERVNCQICGATVPIDDEVRQGWAAWANSPDDPRGLRIRMEKP